MFLTLPSTIRARMMTVVLFFSVPVLLVASFMIWQTKLTARQIDDLIIENAAIARAVQQALANISDGNTYVHAAMLEDPSPEKASHIEESKRHFKNTVTNFNVLIKALAWGSESRVFREDEAGKIFNEWTRLNYEHAIGVVRTSDRIRQFAGRTDIYHSAFSRYAFRAIDALEREEGPSAAVALEKAEEFEHLVSGTLQDLMKAVDQDGLLRRKIVRDLQFRRLNVLMGLAVMIFFGVLISSWVFVNSVLVKPLKDLIGQAQRIGAGDLQSKISLHRRDEIGELAKAFNEMTAKLRNLYSSLDAKVAERTKELESSRLTALNMMAEAERARVKAEVSTEQLKQEMSERQKLQGQLIQAQKMETVGTLAGGIAHDLNNQLTPVKGYIDLILAQTPPGDPNHLLLTEANNSVERCAEVIHRLMGFSRSSNQKKIMISIPKIFQELKGLLQNFLPSTIRVEILCPGDTYPVEGNETELQTVFMNLATNARDAMPEGGKLVFDIKNINLRDGMSRPGLLEGPYVLTTVTDNGQGISPDVIKRIFEPFFTTKIKGQGTGLGLAMVFKIVHDVGGWIDVSSQLGKGTTFHVYLPGRPGEVLYVSDQGTAVDLGALVGKHEMILFADDEEMIRKMGKVMLEKLGYRVWLCSDGQEAVSVFRDNRSIIHALILDMTMPNLAGKQTMRKILEIDPKAKIILASGYTVEGSVEDLIKLGAADFLHKPYTIIPLAKCLRAVLAPHS